MTVLDIDTPHGRARAHVSQVGEPLAVLVMGHGAAGGVESVDLVAARDAALSENVAVALVEQPYRVAGRRSPPRAPQLDAVTVPTLVVQGDRDRFGMPPAGRSREVVQVPGDHGLKADVGAVAAAVRRWLPSVVARVVLDRSPG